MKGGHCRGIRATTVFIVSYKKGKKIISLKLSSDWINGWRHNKRNIKSSTLDQSVKMYTHLSLEPREIKTLWVYARSGQSSQPYNSLMEYRCMHTPASQSNWLSFFDLILSSFTLRHIAISHSTLLYSTATHTHTHTFFMLSYPCRMQLYEKFNKYFCSDIKYHINHLHASHKEFCKRLCSRSCLSVYKIIWESSTIYH